MPPQLMHREDYLLYNRKKMKTPKAGVGLMVLFTLPFCAVGGVTAVMAFQEATSSPAQWGEAGFLLIFALLFGGAGFGMLFLVFSGQKKQAQVELLKRNHPDAPWMWRPEWAGGRILCSTRQTVLVAWVFTAFWNLVSFPLAVLQFPEILRDEGPVALLVLMFPLVGLFLLIGSIRATLRWKKFGESNLELQTLPGVIGDQLQGTIHTRIKGFQEADFRLELICVLRAQSHSARSGSISFGSAPKIQLKKTSNRRDMEKILWQATIRVDAATLSQGYQGAACPVSFAIPADCRPTDSTQGVVWRLNAAASLPGVDYNSTFEVPVFKTEASPAPGQAGEAAVRDHAPPEKKSVVVRPTGEGTQFFFPAARNKVAALGLTAFVILWSGVVVFLFFVDAPLLFQVVFSGFDLIFILAVLSMWFGASSVVVTPESVRVTHRFLGFGKVKEFPRGDISGVEIKRGMQSGRTLYYNIELIPQGGKAVTVGRNVKNKREAEWVVSEIEKAIRG